MAYVELNPVKVGMVKNAWDYQWSSVHAHLAGYDKNGLVEVNKMQEQNQKKQLSIVSPELSPPELSPELIVQELSVLFLHVLP